MKFLKRNKNIIFTLVVFFALILLCVQVRNILFPNDGLAVYGNRLDGKVELTKKLDSKIKKSLGDQATKVTLRVSGRILNISITVADEVNRDTAKAFANKSLELLTDEEKNYYDIQFYLIKNKEDAKEFPIIGYKIPKAEHITWTKDR